MEDDPTDLRLIQSVLASLKLTPQPATSEAELERALELGGFDLVIADHRLGFGEGLWVAQRIQERRPGVPIVLLAPSDAQLVPHRETPGSRILPCPKDAAHLEEAVKDALRASKEAPWLAENPVGLLRLDP